MQHVLEISVSQQHYDYVECQGKSPCMYTALPEVLFSLSRSFACGMAAQLETQSETSTALASLQQPPPDERKQRNATCPDLASLDSDGA